MTLAPNFRAGPTGLDAYRPLSVVTIDGVVFVANGYDAPKRWDGGANFYPMGSTAPTTFAVADASGGSTFPLGTVLVYYLVFAVSSIGKETAPQQTTGVAGVSHTMVATKDALVTWTDPGGEYDRARIYRELQGTNDFVLVADVLASTATYTDSSSDASLATAQTYIPTIRATLPPRFLFLATQQGRMWGFERGSSIALYSQGVRVDARFVADDFPDANLLPVGQEDDSGDFTGFIGVAGGSTFFKARASYDLLGDDPATWALDPDTKDRGACNPRCILQIGDSALILDARGLYYWVRGREPVVAGARPGMFASPMQPTWDRLNLAVADRFYLVHDKVNRAVLCYVALDDEPEPNACVVFDYSAERFILWGPAGENFVGVDTQRWGTAGGVLLDATRTETLVRGCGLGYLWQDNVGSVEGATAGDVSNPLDSVGALSLGLSTASWGTSALTGAAGCPVERFASTDTNYIAPLDQNRVYSATSSILTTYHYPTSLPVVGNLVQVGGIPFDAQTAKYAGSAAEKLWVLNLAVEHDLGASSVVVMSAPNDAAFAFKASIDFSATVRDQVPIRDRGFTQRFRFLQRLPNKVVVLRGFAMRALTVPGARR